MAYRSRAAFSLVELSIVLVILGLLVGGILAGKSMIRQSELRSLVTQKEQVAQGVYAFRDKYLAMPGEFYDYKRVWPNLVGTYCYGPTFSGGSNLNNIIDTGFEAEAALAQLVQAGYLTMGRPQILQDGTVRTFWDCRENSMQQLAALNTRLGSAYAIFETVISTATNVTTLQFGDSSTPTMTVEEAYAFDLKYDDGLPYYGRVFNFRTTVSNYCTSAAYTALSTSVTYDTASMNNKACYTRMMLK